MIEDGKTQGTSHRNQPFTLRQKPSAHCPETPVTMPALTPAQLAQAKRLYTKDGYGLEAVGRRFGLSRKAMTRVFMRAEVPIRSPWRVAESTKEMALKAFKRGDAVKVIAARFHVAPSSVTYWARSSGLARPPGRPSTGVRPLPAPVPLRRRCPVEGCYCITTDRVCAHGHEIYPEATNE